MALLQILAQSNSLAFPHILLGHILLEEPKGKWHGWSKHIKQVTKSMSQHKCIILYYYCTDETSEPEMTPECAQCARHTKYSLYSTSNMYIFVPIPKLVMPKQEPFHCPEEFPFPASGHTPWDFISWGCSVCSAVCKHCVPDSLRATAQLGLVLFLFLQAKSTSHKASDHLGWCGLWGYSLSLLCSGCMPRLRPSTQTGQEHLMSFKFSSFWFGGNWLLCAHPQLGKMSQQS